MKTCNKTYTVKDILCRPGEGEQVNAMTIKARTDDLSGQFGIMEATLPPKTMIPPHAHEHEAQAVYVIAGELEFEVGGEAKLRFTAPAGSYIIKPRGVQHCFWNATSESARYIELSGGVGFENFVDDTASGHPVAIKKAQEQHQIIFDIARIPKLLLKNRLRSVHGLKLPSFGN